MIFLSLMTAPKSQFQKWMAAESQCEGHTCVHGGLLGRARPAKDNTRAQTLWPASPKPAASCTSLSPEKGGWEMIQRQENMSVGSDSLCLYQSTEKFMQIKTSHRTAGKLPATLLVREGVKFREGSLIRLVPSSQQKHPVQYSNVGVVATTKQLH